MKKISFILITLFSLFPALSHAAEFYFDYPKEVKIGESVVTLRANTFGEKVNALAGKIELPKEIQISNIFSGDSSVILWIENPRVIDGVITFSGITPGGFQDDVKIFSFIINKSASKQTALTVSLPEFHRSDIEGTLLSSRSKDAFITFSDEIGTIPQNLVDNVPPESFSPLVASDPDLEDGQYLLIFNTQDKGTGVGFYTWSSALFGSPKDSSYKDGVSPILIPKSAYWGNLYVKAYDNAGNVTIAKVSGPYHYALVWFAVIIILLILCILSFFVRHSSQRSS